MTARIPLVLNGDTIQELQLTDNLAGLTSGTELLKGDGAGGLENATPDVDFLVPGGPLDTPSSGNVGNCTVDGTNLVGFLIVPQNAQTSNYTLTATDIGKVIYHAVGAGAATYTIPANASVPYAVGTAITFVNMSSSSLSIAINSDTLYQALLGNTGTRSLSQYGVATALKITSTSWILSGSGIT